MSAVIPVYNEEHNLEPLYQELKSVLVEQGLSYEIIFVDDGSTDGSFQVLRGLNERDPRVKVIQFRRNFGQTAAFSAGFNFAHGEIIVTLDADGQNDPADIPRLLAKLNEGDYDFVNGWRVDRKESLLRRAVSKSANLIISRSSRITIHDRGCSLKAFRRDLVENMRLYGQLHRFLPEIASVVGARVAEIPVKDRARRSGVSKYGSLSRTPRVILDLVTVVFLLQLLHQPNAVLRLYRPGQHRSGRVDRRLVGGNQDLLRPGRGLGGFPRLPDRQPPAAALCRAAGPGGGAVFHDGPAGGDDHAHLLRGPEQADLFYPARVGVKCYEQSVLNDMAGLGRSAWAGEGEMERADHRRR